MNEIAKRLFAEKAAERRQAEEQLVRIARGDDEGLVDTSDEVNGFRYGAERLENLRRQTMEWLDRIEQDTLELEQVTGCNRP